MDPRYPPICVKSTMFTEEVGNQYPISEEAQHEFAMTLPKIIRWPPKYVKFSTIAECVKYCEEQLETMYFFKYAILYFREHKTRNIFFTIIDFRKTQLLLLVKLVIGDS